MTTLLLGVKVKDKITGFVGYTVSKTEYLYGCVQYGVEGPVIDGKTNGVTYLDEDRLTPMARAKRIQPPDEYSRPLARPGGPRDTPPPRSTPPPTTETDDHRYCD